jgi:hypothetical protein
MSVQDIGMDEPPSHNNWPFASFRVTLIGCTAAELRIVEDSLRRVKGPLSYETKSGPSITASSFPPGLIHAVAFTPASSTRLTAEDVENIRAATGIGTCRVYLVVFDSPVPESDISLLDEFIQKTSDHTANAVAEEIVAFFREADALNRGSTFRGIRDAACLRAYASLTLLWNCSYVFGVLHILNALMQLKRRELWPGVHVHPNVSLVAAFFGAFFIVISVSAIFRNALFSIRVMKQLSLEFPLLGGLFSLAAAATAYSIAGLGESTLRTLASSALAVAAYLIYMYSRRVRVECTSLSEVQAAMGEPQRRTEILARVGKSPLGSNAYPFFSFRSKSLFISYGHGSEWSRATAGFIERCADANGFQVFLDRSSIRSGSLWRQALLRSLSECGFFIAVLDGQFTATQWVLAESVYAAMLRKSIGKPRILAIVRNAEQLDMLRRGPFGILFMDVFNFRHELCDGGTILIAGDDELSEARVLQALSRIRPMCLLC